MTCFHGDEKDLLCWRVPAPDDQAARDDVFWRMESEGLLAAAMSALSAPTLADWRRETDPGRGWLLRCEDAQGVLLGAGLFTPWRGRVWSFDCTAFRASAGLAVPMVRGGLDWFFAHAPCEVVVGCCPLPNRHAWRLARACGFREWGRLPDACWWARRNRFVDGLFLVVTPQDLRVTEEDNVSEGLLAPQTPPAGSGAPCTPIWGQPQPNETPHYEGVWGESFPPRGVWGGSPNQP